MEYKNWKMSLCPHEHKSFAYDLRYDCIYFACFISHIMLLCSQTNRHEYCTIVTKFSPWPFISLTLSKPVACHKVRERTSIVPSLCPNFGVEFPV